MKMIFGYLAIEIKLKFCNYNKAFQNLININLLHYKILSGRYVIYEANGKRKGKEYNILTDNIMFEGEYLNGKKNGKGKEYNEYENIIFEGEYKDGKKEGQGKEFDESGNLIFEGEYENGLRKKGYLKEYYEGKVIFEADYSCVFSWSYRQYEAVFTEKTSNFTKSYYF